MEVIVLYTGYALSGHLHTFFKLHNESEIKDKHIIQ